LKDLLTNKHQNPSSNTHFVQHGTKVSGETRITNGNTVEVKPEPMTTSTNANTNGFISNGVHLAKKVIQKSVSQEERHKNGLSYQQQSTQAAVKPVTSSIQPKQVSQQQQRSKTLTNSTPNGESQLLNAKLSTCSLFLLTIIRNEKVLNGFGVCFFSCRIPISMYIYCSLSTRQSVIQ
jgi:hypothetical protein